MINESETLQSFFNCKFLNTIVNGFCLKIIVQTFKSLILTVGHLELFDFVLFLGNR